MDTHYEDIDTVVGLYDDFAHAENAISDALDEGFTRDQFSIIANNNDDRYTSYVRGLEEERDEEDTEDGAGFGAVVGTLTGLGVALIPGLGSFVVAGAAGAALFAGIGAATGAGVGGLTAALTDMGMDDDDALMYSTQLQQGGVLVIARVHDDLEDKIEEIMRRHNPMQVEEID